MHRALKSRPSTGLNKTLRKKGRDGIGQLADHTCCAQHVNAEIVIMMYEEQGADHPEVMAVVRAQKTIEKGSPILIHYDPDHGMSAWEETFKCRCCKCRGACSETKASEEDFIERLKRAQAPVDTSLLHDTEIAVGVMVSFNATGTSMVGEVEEVADEKCRVLVFDEDVRTSFWVEKSKCKARQDQLWWKECQAIIDCNRLQSLCANGIREQYLEATIVERVSEWMALGATGRVDLPAAMGNVWVAAADFTMVDDITAEAQGEETEEDAMLRVIQVLGEWGKRKGPPLPIAMYDHVFLPVNPRGSEHWMLVHFEPRRKIFRMLDPRHNYGKSWHNRVATLSWAWLMGVQQNTVWSQSARHQGEWGQGLEDPVWEITRDMAEAGIGRTVRRESTKKDAGVNEDSLQG